MIDGTMERSQPGCHRRTAGWSRRWWPHHHDCPGSANCSPEQGGVPTPYAPCHDDRRSPTNASAVRDDAAPRDPETAGRIGRHTPAGVHASRVLPAEQHHVSLLHGRNSSSEVP